MCLLCMCMCVIAPKSNLSVATCSRLPPLPHHVPYTFLLCSDFARNSIFRSVAQRPNEHMDSCVCGEKSVAAQKPSLEIVKEAISRFHIKTDCSKIILFHLSSPYTHWTHVPFFSTSADQSIIIMCVWWWMLKGFVPHLY